MQDVNTTSGEAPEPLRRQDVATWRPWRKGPGDLILVCAGGSIARFAYMAYLNWPLRRGRRYLPWVLGHIPGLSRQVRKAKFRSRFGGTVELDMTSPQFHYLAGLFPSEPHELSLMIRLIRPGDTFIDVGTNIGLYLAHLAQLLGQNGFYMAIEPDPENFAFLKRAYGHSRNVEMLDIAVSDRTGTAHLSRKNSLEGTLEALPGITDTVEVRTRRLDELIAARAGNNQIVLKIDVEGHEPAVIRGLTGLAERGILPIMQIEYLPTNAGAHRKKIDQALHEVFGSKLSYYGIANNANLLFPLEIGHPVDDDVLNILAIPPQMIERIEGIFSLPVDASEANTRISLERGGADA